MSEQRIGGTTAAESQAASEQRERDKTPADRFGRFIEIDTVQGIEQAVQHAYRDAAKHGPEKESEFRNWVASWLTEETR
jgi:hypothetical protein